MKKSVCFLLATMLMVGCLSVYSFANSLPAGSADRIQIVTTIFPVYDWVMNILGDNPAGAEVTMLLDSGVDLHNFQPTVDDIMRISTCDMFLYVGGESDEWVEDALEEALNPDMVVISLLDVLGDLVKEEEIIEGMQAEEEEHEQEEDGEQEADEHVWLSLRNASVFVSYISEALQALDQSNAEIYRNHAASYIEKLDALDTQYREAVSGASYTTLLFGDRFPFRYLTDDYDLSYYAAFVGCSAETEASFETIIFLSQKTDELQLPAVMTIEGSDHRIAETIVQSTRTRDQQILVLDSMQSVTAGDVQSGASYLSIMEQNLDVLKDALN